MKTDRRDEFRDVVAPGPRILCVDDEVLIGEVVTRILESQLDCRVHHVTTGEEALRRLAATDYDAVIVDYVMPNMDGGELYRRITESRPEMLPRLLFTTGDTLTPTTLEFIADTGQPLLEKPFGLPELTTAVRGVLPRAESVFAEVGQDPAGRPV
jgi:CheY-like chemotaxis protein